MLRKFFLYGVAGWAVEVVFTGVAAALRRDRAATAQTYLWMHPIYGGTALLLDRMSRRLRDRPWWARALAYTGVMYAAEYGSGWVLRKALGRCPWDYAGSRRDVHGLIRLDYAPAWFALSLLFEPLQAFVEQLEAPALPAPALPATAADRAAEVEPRTLAEEPARPDVTDAIRFLEDSASV